MSCCVLSPKHIATLARGIEKLINAPGMKEYGTQDLLRVFRDCRTEGWADENKIYKKLYALNLEVFNSRYDKKKEVIPEIPEDIPDLLPFPRENTNEFHIYRITPKHYQFLKLLECYYYQINEDGFEKNEIRLELKKVIRNLQNFIKDNNEEYDKAKWFI